MQRQKQLENPDGASIQQVVDFQRAARACLSGKNKVCRAQLELEYFILFFRQQSFGARTARRGAGEKRRGLDTAEGQPRNCLKFSLVISWPCTFSLISTFHIRVFVCVRARLFRNPLFQLCNSNTFLFVIFWN